MSGIAGWKDVDTVFLPVQAAGPVESAGDLRALPAAIRVEFVVRVAGIVARVPFRHLDAGTIDQERPGRAGAICLRSICERAAEAGPRGDLSILVHGYEDKARDWNVVAEGI